MTQEGLWLYNEKSEPIFVRYDEIDESVLPKLMQPIGGFCYPADVFCRLRLSSVPFYVRDWLPKPGKMLLFGGAKVGKSFLALQLARCIAGGEPFIGIPTRDENDNKWRPPQVLYLQFEIGTSMLQKRVLSTGQGYDGVFIGTTFAMKLDTKEGYDQLLTAVQAVEPSVLILDPFYKLLTGDENEVQDVMVILNRIDEIIGSFGCSVVILHHSGKDLSRGSRGSSALEGWPDSVIAMKKLKDGTRLAPQLLRHAELPPEPIDCQMVNFEFEATDRILTISEKVEATLKELQVAKEADFLSLGSRGSVHNALNKLIAQDKVERVERGVYQWKGG